MRDFFVSLTVTSLICALASMIMPDGSIKKYVSLTLALAVIAAICASLPSAVKKSELFPDAQVQIEDRTKELRREVVRRTVSIMQEEIKAAVMKKYSLDPEDITVTVEIADDIYTDIETKGVSITVSGAENMVKLTRIKYYVEEYFLSPCAVEYKE